MGESKVDHPNLLTHKLICHVKQYVCAMSDCSGGGIIRCSTVSIKIRCLMEKDYVSNKPDTKKLS